MPHPILREQEMQQVRSNRIMSHPRKRRAAGPANGWVEVVSLELVAGAQQLANLTVAHHSWWAQVLNPEPIHPHRTKSCSTKNHLRDILGSSWCLHVSPEELQSRGYTQVFSGASKIQKKGIWTSSQALLRQQPVQQKKKVRKNTECLSKG